MGGGGSFQLPVHDHMPLSPGPHGFPLHIFWKYTLLSSSALAKVWWETLPARVETQLLCVPCP